MPDSPKVVKLAQPGFDVKTAGDENLIYNSNWPLLKIVKEGSFTIPDINQDTVIVNHDLGYVPLFWISTNTSMKTWGQASGVIVNEPRSEINGNTGGVIRADANRLFYTSAAAPALSGSIKIYYYVFALDVTTNYIAPTIKTGGFAAGRGEDKVFKLAKEGKSIDSQDLDDYVIHSRARSPLIHSVTNVTTGPDPTISGGYGFRVYHNLGYNPLFFAFLKVADGSYEQMPSSSGGAGLFGKSTYIEYNWVVGGETIGLVILKDPFEASYAVNVAI